MTDAAPLPLCSSSMARLASMLLGMVLVAGCASTAPPPPPTEPPPVPVSSLILPPGHYEEAFDAMRETLRGRRFVLDRVDGVSGVITTRPKSSAGLATPWDTEQTSFTEEWQELANYDHRIVRVWFHPMDEEGEVEPPAEAGEPLADLRHHKGEVRMDVVVIVERNYRSGWRLNPNAIRLSSYTQDPALVRRGMARYSVPWRRDDGFSEVLIKEVANRIEEVRSAAPPATSVE